MSAIRGQRAISRWTPMRAATLLFGLALLVYLTLAPQVLRHWELQGDEPDYLSIAESLAFDHDLNLANNSERSLQDAHVSLTSSGAWRPMHMVGLPLLISLPYALGDRAGVVFFFNVLAALLAANVYLLAWEVSGEVPLSLVAWGVTALAPPLLVYAFLIYPEMPGALLLVWSVRQILRVRIRAWRWALLGAACSFLPWLVIRFAPVAAFLMAVALATLVCTFRNQRRQMAALVSLLLLPGLGSAAFYVFYQMHLYGSLSPIAGYTASGAIISLPGLWGVILALPQWLLDQRSGLFIYAPIYASCFLGLAFLHRERRNAFWLLAAIVTLQVLFGVMLPGFWVQWAPPTRYLVSALPLASIGIAYAWGRARSALPRGIMLALLAFTLVNGWFTFRTPGLTYNRSYHRSYLLSAWNSWLPFDATRAFPLFAPEFPFKDNRRPGTSELAYIPAIATLRADGGQVVADPQATSGIATALVPTKEPVGTTFRSETFTPAMPGRFSLRVRAKSASPTPPGDTAALAIEVWGSPDGRSTDQLLARRQLLAREFASPGRYRSAELSFLNPREQFLVFRLVYPGQMPLYLDILTLAARPSWWESWGLACAWMLLIMVLSFYGYRRASRHGTAVQRVRVPPVGFPVALAVAAVALGSVGIWSVQQVFYPVYRSVDLPRFTGAVQPDPAASHGYAVVGSLQDPAGALVYGPYMRFMAGRYRIHYRLRLVSPAAPDTVVATLSVTSQSGNEVLASREVTAGEFSVPGRYQDLSVEVLIPGRRTLEFPVYFSARAALAVDTIRIIPVGW